jgi:hypothetical protein
MIINKVRAVVGRWAGGERERYALSMTHHFFLSIVTGIAVLAAVGAQGQTSTIPLESHGEVGITPLDASSPRTEQVACRTFYGPSWTRVSADAPVVSSAQPYVVNDVGYRRVAYFTNNLGHLLQCIDGGFPWKGCGDRHLIYKPINGRWVKDEREIAIVC